MKTDRSAKSRSGAGCRGEQSFPVGGLPRSTTTDPRYDRRSKRGSPPHTLTSARTAFVQGEPAYVWSHATWSSVKQQQ